MARFDSAMAAMSTVFMFRSVNSRDDSPVPVLGKGEQRAFASPSVHPLDIFRTFRIIVGMTNGMNHDGDAYAADASEGPPKRVWSGKLGSKPEAGPATSALVTPFRDRPIGEILTEE